MNHYFLIPAVLVFNRVATAMFPTSDEMCRNATLSMAAVAVVLVVRGELTSRQMDD